ncbi:homoserine kinase [Aureococcus anophagefferens]|uniref:Homoserine kinase n=1 Tax=Aureococcus anophagefferens TaxID=44056 RepID=A0ABR1FGG6_AURAN
MKRVRSKGGMEVKCPRNRVVVRVPATTANMGPGFDALGMGIDIWNEISVERAGSFSIETEGEGVGAIPEEVGPNGESKHTVMVALKRAFEYAGETLPPVRVCCRNRVPVCSGFGSSSAAIVGGLVAGLALAGAPRRPGARARARATRAPHAALAQVSPAIYGGIQLSVQLCAIATAEPRENPQLALSRRVPTPEGMRLVAYVPSEKTRFSFASKDKTTEMRALLPATIPRADAVFNIQRTARLSVE